MKMENINFGLDKCPSHSGSLTKDGDLHPPCAVHGCHFYHRSECYKNPGDSF